MKSGKWRVSTKKNNYISHSHFSLFVILFCALLSFWFRPSHAFSHFISGSFYIENRATFLTTFSAMENERKKREGDIQHICTISTLIHKCIPMISNCNNFWREKICPHINCDATFFLCFFLCLFMFNWSSAIVSFFPVSI